MEVDLIKKITAPNPSVFTGKGTNTYLIGKQDLSLIDPGPNIPEHIEEIIKTGNGNIKRILVTHTHKDIIETEEYTLEAIHTPGHASNHFCFLVKEINCLITGDHIMDGSTVVIGPPDGNMNDYLDSLEHLLSYKVNFFAPGHGNFMHEPKKTIQSIIRHRLSRENKAIRKLKDVGENSLNDLVKHVYDDVSEQLHPIALYSLEAHLIKLMNEKKVEKNNNFYRLI